MARLENPPDAPSAKRPTAKPKQCGKAAKENTARAEGEALWPDAGAGGCLPA